MVAILTYTSYKYCLYTIKNGREFYLDGYNCYIVLDCPYCKK